MLCLRNNTRKEMRTKKVALNVILNYLKRVEEQTTTEKP